MSVQAVVQSNWRTVLARVFALDTADPKADISFFKLGEGGFNDIPPKVPKTPLASRVDIEAEGERVTGTVDPSGFTFGSDIVTGVGTAFLSEVMAGQWVKPGPDQTSITYGSAGIPGTDYDEWGQILSVDSDTQLTLVAVYTGATNGTARPIQVADEPLYAFRKTLTSADVTFFSASPPITEIDAVATALEANSDQLGNSPEFFELGIFDTNGVMMIYVTFDAETKNGSVQLNHIIQLVY